ncbi:MAG: hypothetical protein LCH54_01835 [Bacteroidetes bacterium]|nr:hypothetical protein [Bacteroidota bacterium]
MLTVFFLFLNTLLSAQDLLVHTKSNVFYPLMNYESAYIEGGHTLGLHLPDYMALASLKYNYADSANYSITLGLGLPSWQVGFQKHLFSVWNHPVNLKLSGVFFFQGFGGDIKLENGIYKSEVTNLTGVLAYGKTWFMNSSNDEKYIQLDLYYLIRLHHHFSIGFGGGISENKYEVGTWDQNGNTIISTKEKKRITYQAALTINYIF